MSISFPDFWKLIIESRLLTADQCQQLSAQYGSVTGSAGQGNPKSLAQWLVSQNILSRYQATIILGGRSGPFFYGEYKIHDRIEKGRLAGAFRAAHAGSNHPVLLMFITGQAAQDANRWQQLKSTLPTIVHPNVVRCYDAVDLKSYKFLVLENLQGCTIAEHLAASGPLPVAQACLMMRHAAAGLAITHQHGRPHGDVRPSNLWLDRSGLTKVLIDPNVPLQPLSEARGDEQKRIQASADYMAPELAQPGATPSVVTDIYSLGCSLYELLSGSVPFPGGTVAEKLQRHATEAIKPLDPQRVPGAVAQMVAYMMAKNPGVRFQQAAIVSDQMTPYLDAAGLALQPPTPTATQLVYEQWLARQQVAATTPAAVGAAPAVAVATPVGPTPPQAAAPAAVAAPVATPVATPAAPSAAPQVTPSGPAVNLKAAPRRKGKSVAPTTAVGRAARERAKRKKQLLFAGSAVGTAVVVSIVGIIVLLNLDQAPTPAPAAGTAGGTPPGTTSGAAAIPVSTPAANPGTRTAANGTATPRSTPRGDNDSRPAAQSAAADVEQIADNGDVLWASPTNGSAVNLDFLPGGAQVFLIARPSEMLANAEGERVLRALGPDFAAARTAWETASGFELAEIEQLVLGMYGNGGQFPRVSLVVHPASPISADALQEKWGNPTENENGGKPFLESPNGWAYYVPADGDGAFVMGHPTEIADLASTDAAPPLLRREIGQLVRASDGERHVNAFFAPNFFFADGRSIFTGNNEKALGPVSWFLGDGLKAAMVSLHFTDQLYFEMRMESDIVVDRYTLATQFRDRLQEMPQAIESYIVNLNPGPYWRAVAFRYPGMVSFLHEHTRIGVEGNHAVINTILPVVAAHNLVFGGEMMLASTPGAVVASTAAPQETGPQTIEEVLNSKISISFDQDSLEFSMQNVVKEVTSTYQLPFEFAIKIIGDDLKLDGITRNGQIRDFQQEDKTVAEVLTAMVMKANPVTTVTAPNQKDQKLLWVVAPAPDNPSNRIILITTRQVADQKYTLPEVFRLP